MAEKDLLYMMPVIQSGGNLDALIKPAKRAKTDGTATVSGSQ
jgi:hypothetical protein